MAVAAARGNHVTVRGIPHRTAGLDGATVEQPRAIATPSRFGAVLMLLVAAVEAKLDGVFAVQNRREMQVFFKCQGENARSFCSYRT